MIVDGHVGHHGIEPECSRVVDGVGALDKTSPVGEDVVDHQKIVCGGLYQLGWCRPLC